VHEGSLGLGQYQQGVDYTAKRGQAQGIPLVTHAAVQRRRGRHTKLGFWFLVCYANTQLANQSHPTRIQVVRSNKIVWKRLTESNGTPALDLGHMNVVLM